MKWTILALACAAAPALAAERSYSVTDFDEIRVIGAHRVVVTPGRATTVKASGTPAALEMLSVETQGRTLVIQSRVQTLSGNSVAPRNAANLTITLPVLKAVRLQGAGSVNAALMRAPQADIALAGSGAITVARIEADRANLKLSGAGRIEAAGRVRDLTADMKGSGEIAAARLASADLKLTSATSGRAILAARRSANVTATGSGEVVVQGSPACSVQNNGSGTVSCGE